MVKLVMQSFLISTVNFVKTNKWLFYLFDLFNTLFYKLVPYN